MEYINHKQPFLSAAALSPWPTLPLLLSFMEQLAWKHEFPRENSWAANGADLALWWLRLKCWWGRMCQAVTALCSLARQERSSLEGFQGKESQQYWIQGCYCHIYTQLIHFTDRLLLQEENYGNSRKINRIILLQANILISYLLECLKAITAQGKEKGSILSRQGLKPRGKGHSPRVFMEPAEESLIWVPWIPNWHLRHTAIFLLFSHCIVKGSEHVSDSWGCQQPTHSY